MAFSTTQQTINLNQLLNNTKGALNRLTTFDLKITGDTRAFGTFQGDPFGLGSGVVLSTGRVKDLAGKNTADGDFSPSNGSSPNTTIPLDFKKLPGQSGDPNTQFPTGVFVADLSKLGFDLNSLTIADSGSGVGGGAGRFSGFDLDAIKLSNTLVTKAEDVAALPGLNVFDFSPAGTFLTPGTQRSPSDPNQPDLFGTVNGNVNNADATLGNFDADGAIATFDGAVTLGDGGKIGFDLTSPVSTSGKPLYLYVGEAANNEDAPAGNIAASDQPISGVSDLSTDFGTSGAANDTTSMEISFSNSNTTPQTVFFQFVVGSEEFAEFGGSDLEDAFSFKLNGLDLAQLSEGEAVTINNLAPTPTTYHPDLIYNPVGTGPASNETKLDGYTKVLTFAGPIVSGSNSLVIEVKDVRDGLFDSAVFLKGGTLGLFDPTNPPPTPGGVTVNGQPLQVAEGGFTDTFTLALKTVPKNDVIITVDPDSELNLGKGKDNPLTLTFTPQNALKPQTVNVAAVDDIVDESVHTGNINFSADSSDPAYNGLSISSLNVKIFDNDGPVIPRIRLGTPQSVRPSNTEGERKSGFTVALDSAPKEDVTVTIDPDKQLGLGIGPDNPLTLTFTPENALTPQAFDVTFVDDQAIEGDHSGILSFKASSNDPAFNNLSIPDLKLLIKDNEVFNQIEGTSGNDTLLGTDGSDRITGLKGEDILTGGGGQDRFIIRQGDGTDIITDFGGVGPGRNPSPETLQKADILKFQGEGLTAERMLLTQEGSDLVIGFEGIQNTGVRLQNFNLEDLDNLNQSTGSSIDAGNILFDGQDQIQDGFDVINANWNPTQIFNPNSVIFLNDLDNDIQGLDNSNDVINGQGGNDRLEGLSGNDLLRGGAGKDQFVIGVGKDTDTIRDFTNGEDLIELCGCVSFEQLTIAQGTGANVGNTLISVTKSNELLAVLTGVQANTITSLDFTNVAAI